MTNREWLESKRNEFIQKSRNWIYEHIWVPIVIFAISIAITIYITVFIEKLFVVFLFPLGISEFALIVIAVCELLDKEHKEKINEV